MNILTPDWLVKAQTYDGLAEIPGPKHNSTIINWLTTMGAWWADDEMAWCGTFVAHCMKATGHDIPTHWYRAKAWAAWGSRLRVDRLAPGAVLVFDRKDKQGRSLGGHVGFYLGETATTYTVYGGNQGNKVCRTEIAKSRLLRDADGATIGSRWPTGVPVIGKPVYLSSSAKPVSTNEA